MSGTASSRAISARSLGCELKLSAVLEVLGAGRVLERSLGGSELA